MVSTLFLQFTSLIQGQEIIAANTAVLHESTRKILTNMKFMCAYTNTILNSRNYSKPPSLNCLAISQPGEKNN